MLRNYWSTLLAVLLAFAVLGCSTLNVGTCPDPARGASHFALNVWDQSYLDGSSAGDYSLAVEEYPNDVVVSISVRDAISLRALYFDLEYDPESYRPMVVEPTDALGPKEDLLRLQVFKERGTVYYGQVLTNPDWRAGLTGDALVARVQFNKEPALSPRTVSAAPTSDASQTPLTWDGTDTLDWGYYSQGDYDQNGETNIADLTPLGLNFGETGPFDPDSAEAVVDGDSNGEINIADVTPIGLNFGASVLGGYNVYEDADDPPAYPTTNGGASTITELATVDFSAATGTASTDRLQFQYVVAAPVANAYYWVRPVDTGGIEGTPSTLAAGNPATQPVLSVNPPPPPGRGYDPGTPYIVQTETDYVFTLVDPTDGDVSNDPGTTYNVSNPAAGSIDTADATLNIPASFTGAFHVTAMYNGKPNRADTTLYFSVQVVTTGLYIMPDTTDADWDDVPNIADADVGDSANPYVMGSDTFNNTFEADAITRTIEFSMVANTVEDGSGTAIDVNTLTWDCYPPFMVGDSTWAVPGTFQVTNFCGANSYVYVQDAETNNSPNVYMKVLGIPAT